MSMEDDDVEKRCLIVDFGCPYAFF